MHARRSDPGFPAVPLAEGLVVDNQDPEGLGRVQVSLPRLGDEVRTDWARVATPMAGPDRGWVSLPEVGDEVLVGFLHGDPEQPVVLGALHGGQDQAPYTNADGGNDVRLFRSRAGHAVTFDDGSRGGIRVETGSATLTITLEDSTGTVTIESKGDIRLKASSGTLRLEAKTVEVEATDLSVKANASASVEAGTTLALKASGAASLEAPTVDLG